MLSFVPSVTLEMTTNEIGESLLCAISH